MKFKDALEFSGHIFIIELQNDEQLFNYLDVPFIVDLSNYMLEMEKGLNSHLLVV
jgi:hypothetical protein